ncbi:uncharacterized protein V6R79_020048 [Siganus canaliculatus]
MAMKWICGCLLAVALFGCQVDGENYQKPQPSLDPQTPQKSQTPQTTQNPQIPKAVPKAYHSCDVSDHYRMQCGALGISGSDCEAINCCFDGQQCYYGKSLTLECTKNGYFIVVISRDTTLPNLDLETVSFYGGGRSCVPVDVTSAFAIYKYRITECGTTVKVESGVVIFENRMSSSYKVAVGHDGATRNTSFELLLQCRHTFTTIEALVIEVGDVPLSIPVATPGPLRVELKIGNGVCTHEGCDEAQAAYTSFYMDTDYPVTKVLKDPVYIEINILERTDPNLVLTLGRCWATSNPYPHSLPQWDLLVDGCPFRDDQYQTQLIPVNASSGLSYPTHYKRFVFKMFTFVSASSPSDPGKGGEGQVANPQALIPLKEKVYIHCDTAVCQPSLGNNCEPRCFRKRRALASFTQRTETPVITSPEIVFIDTA